MIRVKNALKIVSKDIKPLGHEVVKVTETLDRILAEDIYSDFNIPGFDNSAMDGYVLRWPDTIGASKTNAKVLEVVGNIKAGCLIRKTLRHNQAVKIMTGAPVPKGADSVVMVENTKAPRPPPPAPRNKDFIEILKEVKLGENIRKAGEDIKKGELVIKNGTLLTSGHIGILASLGKSQIKVAKKPKVAILATGNEVIDIDKKLSYGKLHSSNTYTLFSQILKCGGIPKNLGIAKDNPGELEKKIKQGFDCDIILTSGGVSVGDYDLVKDVLVKIGTNIKFWKVAMRPGKPLVFGTIKDKPVFGLPGNPVSSMICFEIFVKPLIMKMLNLKSKNVRKEAEAELREDISKKKGLMYFLRAKTQWHNGCYITKTTGPQGSGILKSMAVANSLIVLGEDKDKIIKGTKVRVWFFD